MQATLDLATKKRAPVTIEGQHSHLEPRTPAVDLSGPGLMLAANTSLVLGYLWVGWVSTTHPGTALSALRGAVLPVLIALAIFGLRPACTRHQLPGASMTLPVAATVALGASVAAVATGNHLVALAAGAAALLLGLTAFGSVMLREAATGNSITQRFRRFVLGAGRHSAASNNSLGTVADAAEVAQSEADQTPEFPFTLSGLPFDLVGAGSQLRDSAVHQ
jgi:hypothetical protein